MALINPLLGSNLVTGAAPFNTGLIGNSAWFNGTDSRMDSPSFSAQADPTCFTFATWVQINSFAVTNNQYIWSAERSGNYAAIGFDANDKLFAYSNPATFTSNMVFRDVGWYHIICSYKGAANTVRMFVNGVEITNTASNTLASPNPEPVAHSHTQRIGAYYVGATGGDLYETDAYLAQTVFLDGFSFQDNDIAVSDFLDTFTFGTNGSQFIPKKDSELATLAGTAGANSYVLDYANSSALGNDISSKNNNFTLTNLSSANQSVHTPSKVYATFNPLAQNSTGVTLTEGNTKVSRSSSSFGMVAASIGMSTGKWYCEVTVNDVTNIGLGIVEGQVLGTANRYIGQDSNGFSYDSGGNKVTAGSGSSYGDSFTNSDVIGILFDADNGKLYFSKNGTIQNSGDTANGTGFAFENLTNGPYFFAAGAESVSTANAWNFGQSSFAHTPPSGFQSLNSSTLTAPDYQGIDYFDATIYEGNGTGQRVGDFVPYTDVGTISQSVAFNAADEDELRITTAVSTNPTNVQKKTISCWLKPIEARENWIYVGNGGSDSSERIYSNSSGQLQYITRGSGSQVAFVQTAGAFLNDSSQWVHVVFGLDYTTGSTEADRVKIYVNGVRITDLTSSGLAYPAANMTAQAYINKASTEQIIGCHPDFHAASDHSNMYYAEYFMVDGHQLDASVFGQLDTSTNRWVPKASSTVTTAIGALSGGFGNCGFYLDFSNTSDYGEDDSGNNRDFTEGGVLDATNQSKDTPSKNYAVYDTVKGAVYTAMSMSEGNLTTKSGNGSVALAQGFPIQDGYWYYEVNFVEDANNMVFGLYNPSTTVTASDSNPSLTGIRDTGIVSLIQNNGGSNSIGLSTSDTGLSNPSAGDVVGIYIRKVGDTYGMWFSLNGTAMNNTPAANATATADIDFLASIELVPAAHYSNAGTKEAQTNFGQLLQFDGGSTSFDSGSDGNWKHAPVTGFKALNQDNLDDVASKLTVWSWIKNRDATDSHILVDRIRGVGKTITSDETSAAVQQTNMNTVQRFLQRGVQIGNDVTVNTANESYVLWQWLAGDSATTGSTTSPAGTIASTTIVADAGHFSVGSYTGNGTDNATVGHGLGAIPEMIIVRNLSRLTYGLLWHKDGHVDGGTGDPSEFVMDFARASHFAANNTKFGGTDETYPTANVFKIGNHNEINANTESLVFYAFRSVPGVCKVGVYHGNGNADGAYVSVGFRPRWVMIKSNRNARDFVVADTTRHPTNVVGEFLYPSSNAVESARGVTSGSDYDLDILSDGFKLRCADGALNDSTSGSNSYMYIAMADIGGNGTLPPIYGR